MIGVGNAFRGDDAVGLVVAERLKAERRAIDIVVHTGDVLGLCETWKGAELAFVVDAIASGEAPGTIRRYEVGNEPIPLEAFRRSTHAFGVSEAIELGRAVGALPPRLVVYGVVGSCFQIGRGLSPAVEGAVDQLVERIHAECDAVGAFTIRGDDARDRVAR